MKYSIPMRGISAILMLLAVACGTVQAQSADEPKDEQPSVFTLRGFGTLGVAHSTEKKADFLAHDLQAHGAGLSRKWSPDVDSRIGVQLNANLTQKLSGVVQVVSEQRYDGSYRPEVEWANLKYEVTPDFSFRVGRIVLPSFMVADYRKVGYATPWVRPPLEVYSMVPLTRSDGADVSYRMRFGEFKNTIQGNYGESSAHLVEGGKVKGKNGWGLSDTLEYGSATLRFSYFTSDLTVDSADLKFLFDSYRNPAFGPAGAAVADKYDINGKRQSYYGIGGSYDPGKWFVMGEWAVVNTDSVFGKREGWYASGGYRIDKFTPYMTYARVRMKSSTSTQGLTFQQGDPRNGPAGVLNGFLNEALAEGPDQKTISLGVRWDFASNAALKMQFDHSDLGKGSPGTLDHMPRGEKLGSKYNVFSLVVDFLF